MSTKFLVVMARRDLNQDQDTLALILRSPNNIGAKVVQSVPFGRSGDDRIFVVEVPIEHTRFMQTRLASTKYHCREQVYDSVPQALSAAYRIPPNR